MYRFENARRAYEIVEHAINGGSARRRVLNLSGYGLAHLPRSIGTLKHLRRLDLSDNRLTSLPREIGHLKSLAELSLRQNRLKTLPLEIGQLQALEKLDLRQNQELGELPPKIKQILESIGIHAAERNYFEKVDVTRLENRRLFPFSLREEISITFESAISWNRPSEKIVETSPAALAHQLVRLISLDRPGAILQLGAGSGAITKALIFLGVEPSRLILVEQSEQACQLLRSQFPQSTVISADAYDLRQALGNPITALLIATISCIPILKQPLKARMKLIEETLSMTHAGQPFLQIVRESTPPIPTRGYDPTHQDQLHDLTGVRPAVIWIYRANYPSALFSTQQSDESKTPLARGEFAPISLGAPSEPEADFDTDKNKIARKPTGRTSEHAHQFLRSSREERIKYFSGRKRWKDAVAEEPALKPLDHIERTYPDRRLGLLRPYLWEIDDHLAEALKNWLNYKRADGTKPHRIPRDFGLMTAEEWYEYVDAIEGTPTGRDVFAARERGDPGAEELNRRVVAAKRRERKKDRPISRKPRKSRPVHQP